MNSAALTFHGVFLVLAALLPQLAFGKSPSPAQQHASEWTIVHAGVLLADARKPAQSHMSIVMRGDTIKSIVPGFVGADVVPAAERSGTQIIDLEQRFVMAGLVDAHTHIAFPDPDFVGGLRQLRHLVLGGATTARDAGSNPETIFPLRDAVDQGLILGPTIFPSGALLTTTGGHGDFRNGDHNAELKPPASSSGVCDGVEECEKAARRQIQYGATQIKIIATAGVSDNSDTGLDQQFTDAELRAIVDVAHLMKRPVMAHAHGIGGIKAAVRAGVDSIEHGSFLDEDGAQMMARQHAFLDPTVGVTQTMLDGIAHPTPGDPPASDNTKRKILRMPDAAPGPVARLRLAMKYKIPLLTGSDSGYPVTNEMILFVERGGLTPAESLTAATVNGAAAVGASDKIGTLAPGKIADIIAFEGDPLRDIKDVRQLRFVMTRGRVACLEAPRCLSGMPKLEDTSGDID